MSDDNDTPSLGEAFEKAESTLKEGEPKVEAPAVEEKPEESEEEVKEKPSEDKPKESEDKEEDTLEHVDPDEIPEELKPMYKNLMKGFTKGRQKDRAEVAELKKQLKSLQKEPTDKPKSNEPPKFANPQDYYKWVAKQEAEQVIQKENEKRRETYRSQATKDYASLDKRLDQDSEKHDPVVDAVIGTQLDGLLAQHVNSGKYEWEFDHKAQAKKLLKEWDQYLEGYAQKYISRQNELTKKKGADFKKKTVTKPKPAESKPSKMSIRQAMKTAMDKIN